MCLGNGWLGHYAKMTTAWPSGSTDVHKWICACWSNKGLEQKRGRFLITIADQHRSKDAWGVAVREDYPDTLLSINWSGKGGVCQISVIWIWNIPKNYSQDAVYSSFFQYLVTVGLLVNNSRPSKFPYRDTTTYQHYMWRRECCVCCMKNCAEGMTVNLESCM